MKVYVLTEDYDNMEDYEDHYSDSAVQGVFESFESALKAITRRKEEIKKRSLESDKYAVFTEDDNETYSLTIDFKGLVSQYGGFDVGMRLEWFIHEFETEP